MPPKCGSAHLDVRRPVALLGRCDQANSVARRRLELGCPTDPLARSDIQPADGQRLADGQVWRRARRRAGPTHPTSRSSPRRHPPQPPWPGCTATNTTPTPTTRSPRYQYGIAHSRTGARWIASCGSCTASRTGCGHRVASDLCRISRHPDILDKVAVVRPDLCLVHLLVASSWPINRSSSAPPVTKYR
jgi:hypothetical protein